MSYPATGVGTGDGMLPALGSFWSEQFADAPALASFYRGQALLFEQTHADALAAIASASRLTTPLFHRRGFAPLRIYQSQVNNSKISPLVYGTTTTYGGGSDYGSADPGLRYRYPLPAGLESLVAAARVQTGLYAPTITWFAGMDYLVSGPGGYIEFREDPFEAAGFSPRATADGGDQELDLWLFGALLDQGDMYRQWGYVLDVQTDHSSEEYRELVNAFYDCITGGTSALSIRRALAAAIGSPVARATGEVVETLLTTASCRYVITDQHVYAHSLKFTPTVTVGNVLNAGDAMTDALVTLQINPRSALPASLTGLSFGQNGIAAPITGELRFRNRLSTLSLTADDPPAALFDVDGLPADVTAFWTQVRANERTTGVPILQAIRRPDGTLPVSVNPLQLLVSQGLLDGCVLVVFKTDPDWGRGTGPESLLWIRRCLAAHTCLIMAGEAVLTGDVTTDSLDALTANYAGAMASTVLGGNGASATIRRAAMIDTDSLQ